MSRVDVFVPCYNYGRFLTDCVNSILTQSVRDVRVLIINDASTDETDSVAKKLAEQDQRVSYLRHAKNRGHIETYNEGIDWVSADYNLLLSADDLLVPGALARAVALMDAHEDVGLVHGGCLLMYSGEIPSQHILPESTQPHGVTITSGVDFIRTVCMTGENPVATPTAIVRTSLQKKLGGYHKQLPHSGDMEMWLRLAAYSSVGEIKAIQGIARRHDHNMSSDYYARIIDDYSQRKAAFDFLFDYHGAVIPDSRHLRAQANRVLAGQAFWTAVGQFCAGRRLCSRQLFEFAFGLRPSLRFWPPWSSLRAVKSIDQRTWQAVRSLLAGLGGRPPVH